MLSSLWLTLFLLVTREPCYMVGQLLGQSGYAYQEHENIGCHVDVRIC